MRLAMARRTSLQAVYLDARLPAANGRPEVHRGLVLKVRARLRSARMLRRLRAGKNPRKNILEAAPRLRPGSRLLPWLLPRPALKPREVEPLEIHRRCPPAPCCRA